MAGAVTRSASLLALGLWATGLGAAPTWSGPAELPFGQLSEVELREADPALPDLPRPGEERLGPLEVRNVEPTPDGRGWKLTVQPMTPGLAVIPPINFGDGRQSPEWRVRVPRTTSFQAPWMGVGGGPGDVLPRVPFPWAWASLLLLPTAALGLWAARAWRRGGVPRAQRHALRAFAAHWPPRNADRPSLDASHALGRDLLAAHFGEEARSWGAPDFRRQGLEAWSTWILSLDAARFSRSEPPFPPMAELRAALEKRP